MSAPTHSQSVPDRLRAQRDARAPWWALALPVAAFALLLCLQITGGGAPGASQPHQLPDVVERVQQALRAG